MKTQQTKISEYFQFQIGGPFRLLELGYKKVEKLVLCYEIK